MNTQPLGIFDSGVGGLTIYLAVKKLLPREKIIYLADQKNCPYGNRQEKEIISLAYKNTNFLLKKGCKIIIIACNTATVSAITFLRKKLPKIFFVGTVPVVKPATQSSKTGHIVILSTLATKQSKYLKFLIHKFTKNLIVYNLACPGLVELIEQGKWNDKQIDKILFNNLRVAINDKQIDVVATGCTHYPFVKASILKFMPGKTEFIDPSTAVAKQVKNTLILNKLLTKNKTICQDLFFTTKDSKNLEKLVKRLIGLKISALKVTI